MYSNRSPCVWTLSRAVVVTQPGKAAPVTKRVSGRCHVCSSVSRVVSDEKLLELKGLSESCRFVGTQSEPCTGEIQESGN